MHRRYRRALGWALAVASLSAATPAQAQVDTPGKAPFDSREDDSARPAVPTDAAALQARNRLSAQLGREGVLDLDERTGTPRLVARLDGFLTGPSGDDPAQVALGYVRDHEDVFGLSAGDLAALRLARRYTDGSGITHLTWAQTWHGIEAWDNDLHASVTADGRLVNVGGSPVPGLGTRTAAPELTASQALGEALGDAGRRGLAPRASPHGGADQETTFSGGHDARLVLFTERAGDVHLAWDVTDRARPAEVYEHVVDARSGEVLYRENQVQALDGGADVFEYTPAFGPPRARKAITVDSATDLSGQDSFIVVDANSDGTPDAPVPATSPDPDPDPGPDWDAAFSTFGAVSGCHTAPCTWRNGVGNSWQGNVGHTAANAYYFVSTFHDWLEDEVGFTDATGGFGGGSDRLRIEVFEGASTSTTTPGTPNGSHLDNAFAVPQPDGAGGQLTFFLWSTGRNTADDPTVIYHEYGHALSNRLVVRPDGTSGLGTYQSNSMGEGWSDWYAMDYLVDNNLETDSPGDDGDVLVGAYVETRNSTGIRNGGLDCPVGSADADCSSRDTYGELFGGDVHTDGEIWAQTLWDLRTALGGNGAGAEKTRKLVTEAMRLSPVDPTFLDMRNAILQADQALFSGADRDTIWVVFAARGMGMRAFTAGGGDKSPEEDFTAAPAAGSAVTVTGRVTDAGTGAPIAGALVELADLPGDQTGLTDAGGNYSIPGLAAGTYPHALISAAGYELVPRSITIAPGSARVDQRLRRNFAAASGGATVAGFDPPDFGPQCGAAKLIDGDLNGVWGSRSHNGAQNPGEKKVTIALPQTVDVGAFRIDPGASCGDDDTASTGAFRVETSPNGATFTEAASGTFTPADNHRLNQIAADANGVRFVRFTMRTPQSQAPGASGVLFMDSAEFEVLAKPPPDPPKTGPGPGPGTTQFPPGPAGSATPPDLTAPVGALGLVARQKLPTVLTKGLKVGVECNEPCSARLTATLDANTAKKVKLLSRRSRAKTVKVASGSLRTGPGKRTATLNFTRKAKKRLGRQKRLKLALTAALADASGNKASRTLSVALKR